MSNQMTTNQIQAGFGAALVFGALASDLKTATNLLDSFDGWKEGDLLQLIGDESATIMAMVGTAIEAMYQINKHGITTGNKYANIAGVSLLGLGSGLAAELGTSWLGGVKFDTSAQNIVSFGLQSVGVALLVDALSPYDYSYEAISVDGAV